MTKQEMIKAISADFVKMCQGKLFKSPRNEEMGVAILEGLLERHTPEVISGEELVARLKEANPFTDSESFYQWQVACEQILKTCAVLKPKVVADEALIRRVHEALILRAFVTNSGRYFIYNDQIEDILRAELIGVPPKPEPDDLEISALAEDLAYQKTKDEAIERINNLSNDELRANIRYVDASIACLKRATSKAAKPNPTIPEIAKEVAENIEHPPPMPKSAKGPGCKAESKDDEMGFCVCNAMQCREVENELCRKSPRWEWGSCVWGKYALKADDASETPASAIINGVNGFVDTDDTVIAIQHGFEVSMYAKMAQDIQTNKDEIELLISLSNDCVRRISRLEEAK